MLEVNRLLLKLHVDGGCRGLVEALAFVFFEFAATYLEQEEEDAQLLPVRNRALTRLNVLKQLLPETVELPHEVEIVVVQVPLFVRAFAARFRLSIIEICISVVCPADELAGFISESGRLLGEMHYALRHFERYASFSAFSDQSEHF